jgi:uncharacterized protein YneF (UPF0154 family)
MRSGLLWIVVLLVAIIGGAIWLSQKDSTKPLTKVEKVIPDNALAR